MYEKSMGIFFFTERIVSIEYRVEYYRSFVAHFGWTIHKESGSHLELRTPTAFSFVLFPKIVFENKYL
jgi:hypothetical protein